MTGYPELDLRVMRGPAEGRYRVKPLISDPDSNVPSEFDASQVTFDLADLQAHLDDIDRYSARLSQSFFGDANIHSALDQARTKAESSGKPLRVRLFLDTDVPELHALCWETLRDPKTERYLSTGDNILFSRYLPSPDTRVVPLGQPERLRALVVIANPSDLSRYAPAGQPLPPIAVGVELERARTSLGPSIEVTALASGGQASLAAVRDTLRQAGRYDILYLVCHGALIRDWPRLYLEAADGTAEVVSGVDLASVVGGVLLPPRLVVLASCESAGRELGTSLSAVGPRLVREGIPAVLAMQGNISMKTAGRFLRKFFEAMALDGQIERAAGVARGEVKDEPDAWMPVLFTRLITGSLWPAGPDRQPFEQWDGLLSAIEDQRCVPILGPAAIDFLIGSSRELAQRWANAYRFPLSAGERDDLPQVAQYLAVVQSSDELPHRELRKYLTRDLRSRYAELVQNVPREAELDTVIGLIGQQRRAQNEHEIHRVLAKLPLPLYITTNPDNLLCDALQEVDVPDPDQAGAQQKKDPQVVLFQWKEETDDFQWPASVYDVDPRFTPSVSRPLVYHLFGQIRTRNSVVLTEDEYFQYLTAMTRSLSVIRNPGAPPAATQGPTSTGLSNLIPGEILYAWSNYALLFLGFQVDDWNFRVLFHSMLKQVSDTRRKLRPSVAVQLDPGESGSDDPVRARAYLERYFGTESINLYWGKSEKFVEELWQRWSTR